MKTNQSGMYTAITAATTVVLMAAAASPASAQRYAGGQQGQQRGFAGGQQGGRQQRFARPAPTLATVPVSAMTPYFGLNDDQVQRIEAIQKNARPDMQATMSQIQQIRQSGQQPTRQQIEQLRQQMQTARATMEANRDKAAQEIGLVLTPEQRPAITSFLRDVELFQQVDLPLELIKPLDLNGPQKRKLQVLAQQAEQEREQMFATMQQQARTQRTNNTSNGNDPNATNGRQQIGETLRTSREKMRENVLATLTDPQKEMVTQWEKEHPQRTRGNGGEFRG